MIVAAGAESRLAWSVPDTGNGAEPAHHWGVTIGTSQPVLTLDKVSVTYANGTAALQPLDLALHPREVAVLLGPSGAGKSTLLRTMNMLVPPTMGRVLRQDGVALQTTQQIRAHRRNTAMIFQQHQLIARMSALQNVLMGRLGKHSFWRTVLPFGPEERRLALACLERVGMLDKALNRCDTLSGGQQQRVGIARALAQEPKIILADEPVASLDPATASRVLLLLRAICRQDQIPAVISLHHIAYARAVADRIIGLAGGRVVFDDVPAKLSPEVLCAIYGDQAVIDGDHDDSPSASVRLDPPGAFQ